MKAAEELVGKAVEKDFGGNVYKGKVTSYTWNEDYGTPNILPDNAVIFRVRYEDGDQSDYNEGEIRGMLIEG